LCVKAGFSTGVSPVVLQNETCRLENPEETGRPTRATKGSEHTIRSVTGGGRSSVDGQESHKTYTRQKSQLLFLFFLMFYSLFYIVFNGFSTDSGKSIFIALNLNINSYSQF
jgi:hypothetical protein